MKRFLSASAIGIVFSVIVAATIQAYDEPKSACTRASSPSCCKNSAGCPTTVAADAKQCDIVLGGVRPRIVIEEEEESLLGINLDSSESPCCHESTECPVLKAAQQAKSAAKRTNKKPRAVAIEYRFRFFRRVLGRQLHVAMQLLRGRHSRCHLDRRVPRQVYPQREQVLYGFRGSQRLLCRRDESAYVVRYQRERDAPRKGPRWRSCQGVARGAGPDRPERARRDRV